MIEVHSSNDYINDKKISESNISNTLINKKELNEESRKLVDNDSDNRVMAIENENTVANVKFSHGDTEDNNLVSDNTYENNKRNKNLILDNDSETDKHDNISNAHIALSNRDEENISETMIKRRHKRLILDSDSEEENLDPIEVVTDKNINDSYATNKVSNENGEDIVEPASKKKHKRLIMDSDSEDENVVITPHNKSYTEETGQNFAPLYTTNANGELILEDNSIQKSKLLTLCDPESSDEINNSDDDSNGKLSCEDNLNQKSNLSTLCDPESSDEEINNTNVEQNDIDSDKDEDVVRPVMYKKSKSKNKENEESKKMTGKEAAEQRREIQSESQRMLREANVSLPYHKPKAHSLKEFLSRRSKLASTIPIPARIPPSVAIKMSTEQLELISKKIKEREKEVKEFYKSESESDSEDENDKDYLPDEESNDKTDENKMSSEGITAMEVDSVSEDNMNTKDSDSAILEISSENNVIKDFKASASVNNINKTDTKDTNNENEGVSLQEIQVSENVSTKGNNENGDILQKIQISEPEFSDNVTTKDNRKGDINFQENIFSEASTSEDFTSKGSIEDNENIRLQEIEINNKMSAKDKNYYNLDTEQNLNKTQIENIDASTIQTGSKNQTSKDRNSLDFDFNLDDIEDSEQFRNTSVEDSSKTVENTCKDHSPQKSAFELLKEKLANTTPKLSGNPEELIDLESGVTKENEVHKLMKRFVQHTAKKHSHKHKVKLNIVSVSGGEILKETVAINVDEDDDENVVEEKPGAKLQKLKGELQNQMAQRRSELWQQKATNTIKDESKINNEEKEDYEEEFDDPLLDNEDEEEMTDTESEDEDIISDKQQSKSKFISEEAEEDDEEVENDENSEEEGDSKPENLSNDEMSQQSKYSDVYENMEDIIPKKKTLKRIIQGFTEDSDDELDTTVKPNETYKTALNDTLSDDDIPPPHQQESIKTPQKSISEEKSQFEFLTPITFMTGLQNLNSTSKLKDSPVASSFNIPSEPSPFKDPHWHVDLQKKLFSETDVTDSQLDDVSNMSTEISTQEENDLANMCTGNFSSLESSKNDSQNLDQLANMCTGQFPSSFNTNEDIAPSTQDLLNVCSGSFTGASGEKDPSGTGKNTISHHINPSKEIKSLDDDQDLIISQLLDEEEMENFKKKFDSPTKKFTQSNFEDGEEVSGTGGIIDSDDEDENIGVKKKKQKKLVFSDDESTDNESIDNEEINLHDEDDNEESEEKRDIDYDSEENEIEIATEDDDNDHVVYKPSEFFEQEAELSESEWGSADEDEKELDILETEQGDKEKFNEEKLRNDLEKIHMRRLLDDDNRDIKLLQELLLEDGELHGTGRERQFKWKNIDSMGEGNDGDQIDDDDVYIEEEESEEQWRKRRHEREMFLKEKLAKRTDDDEEDITTESQILKLGQKAILRNQSNSQTIICEEKEKSINTVKEPFSFLTKRGSFLSRSDQVLQRLAEYNKVTTTAGSATVKNSRNFVFQTVSQVETSVSIVQEKKRKASEGTPNVLKKIRLSSNFSPLVTKKKLDKPDRAKKLFGNQ